MKKGDLTSDPRGLIAEAYKIENIEASACRAIFFDWALGVPDGEDPVGLVRELHAYYVTDFPAHPMTKVLNEGGVGQTLPKRRGGRRT